MRSPGFFGFFFSVQDGQFVRDGKPYIYIGTNFWYGPILASDGEGGDFERLTQELDTLQALGLRNLRVLVGADGNNGIFSRVEPTLQQAPGVYNDTILVGLDRFLVELGKRDMQAVLYLNNSWEWSGGYGQYLEWATGLGTSYRQANLPNLDVMWEKQEQLNVGLDLSFFNNRINLVAEWYNKVSNDMLMPLQMPTYMGTNGNSASSLAAPYGNYGKIQNTGLEFTLTAHPIASKNFHWTSEGQISFNSNKLVALAGTASAAIIGNGQWNDVVSMSNVGDPLFSFYGYVTDGIYQSIEEVMAGPVMESMKNTTVDENGVAHPSQNVADYNQYNTTWIGDIRFKDLNGDGKITESDRTNIGSPMPKFTFGWTNTFTYKNWDLSIFLNGSYGNKVLNYLSMKTGNMKSAWANQPASVLDRSKLVAIDSQKTYDGTNGVWNWYEDPTNVKISNPNSKLPRATTGDPNDNDRLSDRYIEDGSYLRVKNITLGYSFPKNWMQKMKVENLRVQMNIQNLFTFTKYTGYDPEIGASMASVNVMGLDNGRYPSPTVYSLGVNLTF